MLVLFRNLASRQNLRYLFWYLFKWFYFPETVIKLLCYTRTSRFRILLALVMPSFQLDLRVLPILMVLSPVYVAWLNVLLVLLSILTLFEYNSLLTTHRILFHSMNLNSFLVWSIGWNNQKLFFWFLCQAKLFWLEQRLGVHLFCVPIIMPFNSFCLAHFYSFAPRWERRHTLPSKTSILYWLSSGKFSNGMLTFFLMNKWVHTHTVRAGPDWVLLT
jgi:hypothetical protein